MPFPSFIFSTVYVYQHGLMGIYFIVWVIIHYCHLFCCSSVIPDLATGSSFTLASAPFNMSPCFLSAPYFLAPCSGHLCTSQASHCTFPIPLLTSAISPRNAALFYWGMLFRNQDLGPRYNSSLLAAPDLRSQCASDDQISVPSFLPVASSWISEAP